MEASLIATALCLVLAAPLRQPAPPSGEAVSRPRAQGELKETIDLLLRAIDAPVEPARWRALGDQALPLLEEIARDPGALPTRRSQALSALGWLGGPRAAAVLAGISRSEREPAPVRMAAVRGLAAAGDLEAVRALLRVAGDARVRAVAAEQIVEGSKGSACAEVEARAAAEDAAVRPIFARALASCAGR